MDVAVSGPLWNKVGPGLERGLRRLCRYDDGALACDCVRFFKWLPHPDGWVYVHKEAISFMEMEGLRRPATKERLQMAFPG